MPSVCFYFQVHQPFRLRHYQVFEKGDNYFSDDKNAQICRKVANKCYLPANRCILELINRWQGRFRVSYSLSGVVLDQFERYTPEVIQSFQELARTGCVEFLHETYFHSLSFLYSRDEFADQVHMQQKRIAELFGKKSRVFRNTELIYSNDIAKAIHEMGFEAIIAEGVDNLLGYRSPNFVYQSTAAPIKVLLKNYRLSDDIAFRFSNRGWKEWPLTADKYAQWIHQVNGCGQTVNLFMDYETFGEHQWEETGIFEFFRHLPEEILRHPDNNFKTPSEVIEAYPALGEFDAPHLISWADENRDLSAWLGNAMQNDALKEVYALEKEIKSKGDSQLLRDWRKLQTSDHFYYMCTKYFADGDVHKYFSPYDSPYDGYINYMNVLEKVTQRLRGAKQSSVPRTA